MKISREVYCFTVKYIRMKSSDGDGDDGDDDDMPSDGGDEPGGPADEPKDYGYKKRNKEPPVPKGTRPR